MLINAHHVSSSSFVGEPDDALHLLSTKLTLRQGGRPALIGLLGDPQAKLPNHNICFRLQRQEQHAGGIPLPLDHLPHYLCLSEGELKPDVERLIRWTWWHTLARTAFV